MLGGLTPFTGQPDQLLDLIVSHEALATSMNMRKLPSPSIALKGSKGEAGALSDFLEGVKVGHESYTAREGRECARRVVRCNWPTKE